MRAAIIGCGVIGKTHVNAIAADGRGEVVWACDTDIERAQALVPNARHAFDLAEVLLDDSLDVIHLCTPHAVHKGQLVAAVAAGRHIICEKPLATTPADLHAMVAAAERHQAAGKIAACIFQHRHGLLARRLQELIAAGSFGALQSANLPFRCTRRRAYYDSAAWRGTWAVEGGGTCINQAIHSIDQLVWLCGGDPVAVTATCANKRLQDVIEVEDEASGSIRFGSGLVATFDIANDQTTGWDMHIEVVGERGSFRFTPNGGGQLFALEHEDQAVVDELRAIEQAIAGGGATGVATKAEYGNLHTVQIADCYDAIEQGRQPHVTIANGATACEVVLGIYHSAATAAEAALPLADANYQHPVLVGTAATAR